MDFLSIVKAVVKELVIIFSQAFLQLRLLGSIIVFTNWIFSQEGAYALIFKSSQFPNQIVATRKGSPLIVGIKTEQQLKEDSINVDFEFKNPNALSTRLGL